jgi:hypothetical protein
MTVAKVVCMMRAYTAQSLKFPAGWLHFDALA